MYFPGSNLQVPRPISRRPEPGSVPLTFSQERLWFLDQFEAGSFTYNLPACLRFNGTLNVAVLEHALNEILRRHETLQAIFPTLEGRPVQVISRAQSLNLPVVDLSELSEGERETKARRLATDEYQRPFDLAQGPLMRASLLRLCQKEHVLLLTVHHIVFDDWSKDVLLRELSAFYEAFSTERPAPLAELHIQYADFAYWQRQWLQDKLLETQVAYWRHQLGGPLPILELPFDHPRPPVQAFRGARRSTTLHKALTESLNELSRREGVTLFMTLLAAFNTLLYRYTEQKDILVGSYIAGRSCIETEGLIGLFVNTLVFRADLSGNPAFRDFLGRIRQVVVGAYAHQELPFEYLIEELQPERDMSRSPLFQVMFNFRNALKEYVEFSGLKVSDFKLDGGIAKFVLVLNIAEVSEGLSCSLEYSADLFDAETVDRMLRHFRTLLEGIVSNPEQRVSDSPLLTDAEQHKVVVEWNDTRADIPQGACVHQLFEVQVERFPDAVAVIFQEDQLTYRELNRRANHLAHYLQKLGVEPEVMVGICVERSLEMVVGLLGILKAGGAYVPLDPEYPRQRLAFMLEDTHSTVLLTQERLVEGLPEHKARVLCLDTGWEVVVKESEENPASGVTAGNLAYVIYTSGSTGTPKGVQVQHRGLCNLWEAEVRTFGLGPDDCVLQFASLSFDASIFEIVMALSAGAMLCLATRDSLLPGPAFVGLLRDKPITIMTVSPSVLAALPVEPLPALRTINVAGEPCSAELVVRWAKDRRFFNLYGPTEATVWSTMAVCKDGNQKPAIGFPITNVKTYLLDVHLQPVPVGVPGELCIAGAGLARGYLNRPELTAELFIPHPFSDEPGARLYKTGDRARYLPDGSIEFLGRTDHQVKLRAFRIELGEIEATLGQHAAVQRAIVMAKEGVSGEKRLIAYVLQDPRYQESEEQQRDWCAEQISRWQTLHDETYGRPPSHPDPTFNIVGWNNSYTNLPLSEAEMRVWLDDTVDRILGLRPSRVLEIGCGTGLLLLRIASHCTRYWGTDFSQVALNFIRQQVALQPQTLSHLTLLQRTADDFEGIEAESFDVVVLNSVVQYLPNIEYLVRVLEGALRVVKPGGYVFVGDVRSLPLLEAFHTSVALHQAPASLSRAALKQRAQKHMKEEEELVVDPAFFIALKQELPGIRQVEILPKRGRSHNELTQFRYQVMIHVGPQCSTYADIPWLNWQQEGLTLPSVCQLLDETEPEMLGLTHVPNRRLFAAIKTVAWLASDEGPNTAGEMREVISNAGDVGIEPDDLWALRHKLPYAITISWARHGVDGCYEVVFIRHASGRVEESQEALLSFPGEVCIKPWSSYANNPLHSVVARKLMPQLRRFLQQRLPEHMVPSAFVTLDALPLTPSGKIDRRALPTPDHTRPGLEPDFVTPRTPVEQALIDIWSEVLGLDQVGIHDDFFELGGHSLLATQVISRVRDALQLDVPLRRLFETSTVAGLAQIIETAYHTESQDQPITRASRNEELPLSFAQQRLWFLNQLEPDSPFYNIAASIRLVGPLNVAVLEQSLNEIIRRHEALRTTFPSVDGRLFQVVSENKTLALPVIDLQARPETKREAKAQRVTAEEAKRPFGLGQGPLLRTVLLRRGEREHVLLLTMHHIVSDGWSMGVFTRELGALYEAFETGRPSPLPELPIQYADFAVWQRQWLQGSVLESLLSYWKQQLNGSPAVLELPTDRPRPKVQTYQGATHCFVLSTSLSEGLKALSRREGATLFTTLLAGFKTLLYRYTGQEDVVVGAPIANRNRAEIEDLIGFFVNTLVLRTDLSGNPSFQELLGRVCEVVLGAHAHQDLPFEKLVAELEPERGLSRTPLFQVMFALQNAPRQPLKLPELTVILTETGSETAKFDLTLSMAETDQGLIGSLEYNTDLFNPATITRMVGHFLTLLKGVVGTPEQRIADLPLLTEAERHQLLVEWNRTQADYPQEACVHQLFELQVERSPDAIAVVFEKEQLSYQELNRQSNQLAHHLQGVGVGPEVMVGICVEPSLKMLVGLLGILKAAGTYVPLDPAYPLERLAFMLENANVPVLLTQARLAEKLPEHKANLVFLDRDWEVIAQRRVDNPVNRAMAENPAYTIYTSGSVGRPKGVEIRHRSLVNLISWHNRVYNVTSADRATQIANISFDASAWEIWPYLAAGSSIHILNEEVRTSPSKLLRVLAAKEITVSFLPTPLAEVVLEEQWPAGMVLRDLLTGGDKLHRAPRQAQSSRLINHYGPTENTVVTTSGIVGSGQEAPMVPPIGRPIANTQIYLLDPQLQPVPIGVPGELHIG
ncbi:MAG: amino acid adenylation domain-containing protein, partial [Acidobacteria bacterium]|nr:amino acid adenylation domain-containing protein [Acidobacteriota bacterium]